jgi:hypothetical protein
MPRLCGGHSSFSITMTPLTVTNSFLNQGILFFCLLQLFSFLDRQSAFAQQVRREVSGKYHTNVWVYTPPAYSAADPTGFPVLLSLHGGSGIVDDNNYNVIVNDSLSGDKLHLTPGRLIWRNLWDPSLPFIVVSPHLKRDFSISNVNEQTWPPELLDEVVEFVKAEYNVDGSRIYVTGISVGGTGTWDYALNYPEKVAAIIPMGGKGAKNDACDVKDVPAWVFHGQDDGLVPNRFSIDMVEAMIDCSPAGKYVPHLNLNISMDHVIWNPLYTRTSGYDIYAWMLSFSKGDDSNKAPFVFLGVDRKIKVRSGPIYLTSEFFDSDGSIANVQWSQVAGSPSLTLQDTDTKFLKVVDPQVGIFTFRLTVTDNDGVTSFDEVQYTIQATPDSREITKMEFYLQNGSSSTFLGDLADDAIFPIETSGTRINILASAVGSTNRVRWSINSDQHTRDNSPPYYIKLVNTNINTSGWGGMTPGEYLVCATPYQNASFASEGTSLCYKIRLSDEVGISKYFAINSDLNNLSSWNSEMDGTGTAPSSFTLDNQWFVVYGTGTIGSSLTISGLKSRLVVMPNAVLTVQGVLNAPLYVEGKGSVSVSSTGSVVQYASLSRSSSVTYNGAALSIPANSTFGNLTILGAGSKTLPSLVTNVKGNLVLGPEADLRNIGQGGSSDLRVSGNISIATASTQPYTLRIVEGYGDQNISLSGDHSFHQMFVEGGATASIKASGTVTLSIGSPTGGGGRIDIHTYSLLKLNGHNLNIINAATLNGSSGSLTREGKIELSGSRLTISSSNPGAWLNLFPARGKNELKFLDVNIPTAHTGFDIKDSLSVSEGVKVSNGKINSNGFLTLLSTPTSTAYVDKIEGTAQIVGNVNVQRVVGNGRMYRYLSFPVKNFTVAKLQQFIPVTGTFQDASTGPGLSTTPSLYVWNEPDYEWSPYPDPASNNTQPLEIGKGYAVYVRDDNNDTRMVLTGELHQGPHTFTINQNTTGRDTLGWTLIGNPYAAPVLWEGTDPDSPPAGWTPVNIDPSIYIRDNELEGFRVWDGEIGDVPDGIVAIGQSFWVRAENAAASLSINESAKQQLTSPMLYRNKRSDVVALTVALKQNERQSNAYVKFKPTGNSSWIRGRDTIKKNGDKLNVSILSSDNHSLAIKTLCDTLCSQEIGLLVRTAKKGTYSISISGSAFDHVIHKLFIFDKFTDQTVEWKEDEDYVFQVTSDPASHARDRFHLLIEKDNVEQPTIRMEDGYLLSTVSDGGQWALNGVDIEGATGAVLLPEQEGEYTIRTIGKSCSKTSKPFNFRVTGIQEKLPEIRVYPNPARNHIKISGLRPTAFDAQFEITTLSGAIVQQGLLDVSAAGEGEIRLKSASPGFYILRISDGAMHQLKFTIQP